jgi:ketosteroid isomerase-like protein
VRRDLVRLLDRGYEIMWREHDPERALRNLDPQFEWVVPGHPEGAVRRGPDATIAFFRDWIEPWEELHVDWELQQGAPDRVLAVLTMRGRGRASGAPAEMRAGQLWFFREDGTAERMVLYSDVDEARRAAGL